MERQSEMLTDSKSFISRGEDLLSFHLEKSEKKLNTNIETSFLKSSNLDKLLVLFCLSSQGS